MDLIKCPYCGEEYSPSYRSCPFCEEERPRKAPRRNPHHATEKKHTHSARGPFIAVLVIVLLLLTWYLFGGKFMEKLHENDEPSIDAVDPVAPSIPDDASGDAVEPDDTVSGDEPAPPDVTDPEPSTVDTPVDVSGAVLNKEDFTFSVGEKTQLKVTGTTAEVTWSIKDASVASISSDGTVEGLKAGTTTAYAKVGDRTLECIVRVKGGASSSTQTVDVSGAKLNKEDFTISVGEKTQLKVTGTTATVTWSIGNSAVASIGTDGTVKGLKTGTTTAYAKVGDRTLECIVRVK